ncbi:MAG TPA: DUF3313 domain-containing protein [Candidatus Eisenbacteria bacterium]|nr:DUF3313 domain-containing protein [Candidatus Eisenbacteria bacterium]
MRRPLVLVLLVVAACAPARQPTPKSAPPEMSGFLDDYAILQPGGPGEADLRYRNPNADWKKYDKALFEPVTIWRSGRKSLDEIPEADLQRLAIGQSAAVKACLRKEIQLVDQPGPGTMRIRLALTLAKGDDPVLDVYTMVGGKPAKGTAQRPLAPTTRAFVAAAAIEGEVSDSVTREVLAEGVNRSFAHQSRHDHPETWEDVDENFQHWATWLCGRLRAVREGQPSAPAP